MINRSYPGFLDLCWPESLTLRRVCIQTTPKWQANLWLVTWQHWCRCPEVYLRLGRISINVVFAAGLLPAWHPTINKTYGY